MQRMKKVFFAGLMAAAVLTACSRDDDGGNNNNQLNATDRDFAARASISNNAEIMTGQLAVQRGNSGMVRAFGQSMIAEHTTAQNDLRSRASSAGLTLADTVDAAARAMMQQLNTLNGRAFDSVYIRMQVMSHQNTLNLFQTQINSGANVNLRNYATQYLPNIQMHFNRADSIRRAL
jgi:putative membrane protein